jgi:hypothetical protein
MSIMTGADSNSAAISARQSIVFQAASRRFADGC